MGLENTNSRKDTWRAQDSARRAEEHIRKHRIPGMKKWITKLRGGEANQTDTPGDTVH
ncbi:MAG: hypothetical protein ABA06_03470 [Parcubacteria bacterium C7867-001]|nr:MAG: hypothetical protein ABA06_03470 [Parcubacteria bacterium C7867-001]